MTKLVTPVINSNGNTAEDLIEKLKVVLHNLGHLMHAMQDAHDIVHGRNFQTLPDHQSVQREAQIAWYERCKAIDTIENEIRDMTMAIYDQKFAREKYRGTGAE